MDSIQKGFYSVSSQETYQYLKQLMDYPQKDCPQNLLEIDPSTEPSQDPLIKAGQLIFSKTNFDFEQAALFAGPVLTGNAPYDLQPFDKDEDFLKLRIRFVELQTLEKDRPLPEQGSLYIEQDGQLVATLKLLKQTNLKRGKAQQLIQEENATIWLPQSFFESNEHKLKFILKFVKEQEELIGTVTVPGKQVLDRKKHDKFKRMFPLFNGEDSDTNADGDNDNYMTRDLNELLKKDKLVIEFKSIQPFKPIDYEIPDGTLSQISKGTQDIGPQIDDEEDEDEENQDNQSQNIIKEDNEEVLEIKYNEPSQKTYIRRQKTIQVIQTKWNDLDSNKEFQRPTILETIQLNEVKCESDCIQFASDNSGYCVIGKSTIAKILIGQKNNMHRKLKSEDNIIGDDKHIKLFTVLKQANALAMYMLDESQEPKASVFLIRDFEYTTHETEIRNTFYPTNCTYMYNVYHNNFNNMDNKIIDDTFDLIFGTEEGEIIVSRNVIIKNEDTSLSETRKQNQLEKQRIHNTRVTCIKKLERDHLMASGATQDNFVSIWDLNDFKKISRINCPGHILDLNIIEKTHDMAILSSRGLFRINQVFPNDYNMYQLVQSKKRKNLVICFLGDDKNRFLIAHGNKLIQITCSKEQNCVSKIEQKFQGQILKIKAFQDKNKETRVLLLIKESSKSQLKEQYQKEQGKEQIWQETQDDSSSDSDSEPYDLNSHEIDADDGQINVDMIEDIQGGQLNFQKSLKLPKQRSFQSFKAQRESLSKEQYKVQDEHEGGDQESTARAKLIQEPSSKHNIQSKDVKDDTQRYVQELILFKPGVQLEKSEIGYLDNHRYQNQNQKIQEMYIIGDKKKYLFTRQNYKKTYGIILYELAKFDNLMKQQNNQQNNDIIIKKGDDLLAKNRIDISKQNDYFSRIVGVVYIPSLRNGVITIVYKNKGIKMLNEGISQSFFKGSIGLIETSSVNEINVNRERKLQAMAITSDQTLSEQWMVTGDENGQIVVWIISQDLLKFKQPHQIIDYSHYGQVVSIKLIQQQNSTPGIGLIVSLHKCTKYHSDSNNVDTDTPDDGYTPGQNINKQHNHLVITSLRDFQQTRMIEIEQECVDFDYIINENKCLSIFVIQTQNYLVNSEKIISDKKYKDENQIVNAIKYDLSFQYNHTDPLKQHNLTLRDQNILTLFSEQKQSDDVKKHLLALMQQDGRRGIIDCVNSVNLLNFFAKQRIDGINFKILFEHGAFGNLADSSQNYVSNYLFKSKSYEYLDELFDQFTFKNIPFDPKLIEYGLFYKSDWVNEIKIDPFFVTPQFWQTKSQIKGKIKFSYYDILKNRETRFETKELKLVSDSFIDSIIERSNENDENQFWNYISKLKALLINNNVDEEDQQQDEDEVIEILQSIEPYKLTDGSDDIIKFLDLAGQYPIEVFENTKIGKFIDYIWEKNYIDLPLLQYTCYVSILLIAAFTYDEETVAFKYVIFIINIIYVLNELVQMGSLGLIDYLKDSQNYIEFIGFIFVFLYTESIFYDTVVDEDSERQYLSILVLMNLTTLILQLASIFQKTRITWIIISNSLYQVFTYLVIPGFFIVTFAISRHVTHEYNGWSQFVIFGQEITTQYQQVFGENIEDMADEKGSVIFIYLMGTILINIVCLNIIISVVTDNYDIVMQRIDAEDSKYKAEKMETYHRIMQHLDQLFEWLNFGDSPKKYLLIIQYKEHVAKKNQVNNGKFKNLMQKVESSTKKLSELQKSFDDLKTTLKNQDQKNDMQTESLKQEFTKQINNKLIEFLQTKVNQKQEERFQKLETMLLNINETIDSKLKKR